MTGRSFLSTTPSGVARLTRCDSEGEWKLDEHLQGEEVHSIAVGPVESGLVLAGTTGNGVFKDRSGEFRWRLVASNGRIIVDSSEGYSSQSAARRAVENVQSDAGSADIE